MKIIKCDRCKEEVKEEYGSVKAELKVIDYSHKEIEKSYDLCRKCTQDFLKFISSK